MFEENTDKPAKGEEEKFRPHPDWRRNETQCTPMQEYIDKPERKFDEWKYMKHSEIPQPVLDDYSKFINDRWDQGYLSWSLQRAQHEGEWIPQIFFVVYNPPKFDYGTGITIPLNLQQSAQDFDNQVKRY